MLRTCLTVLVLSLSILTSFAQAPGYLGKKFTLQGEFHSFPALSGPTVNNRGLDSYDEEGLGLGLNWSAGARLGYVLSRQQQLILSFDYLKTGVTQNAYYLSDFDYSSDELFFNLQGVSVGIGNRKFKPGKGGLAPMGKYSGFSLNATFLKGSLNSEFSYNTRPLNDYGIDPKHMVLSLGYEFGTNYIIKDRLILNVGAKLGLTLSPRVFRFALEEEEWTPNDGTFSIGEGNTDNFKTVAASRFSRHSILMIYLGIGLIQ